MKQITEKDVKIKTIGNIVEKIVNNFAIRNKWKVIHNTDEYGYWDSDINNAKIQIKAITPFVKFDCWSINASKTKQNIDNIFKCDKLWILSLPCSVPHELDGYLLEVDMTKLNKHALVVLDFKDKKTGRKNTTPSLVIPRSLYFVKKLYKITEEEERALYPHATSTFRKKTTK